MCLFFSSMQNIMLAQSIKAYLKVSVNSGLTNLAQGVKVCEGPKNILGRRRRETSGGMPPGKFWNLESLKCHFLHFSYGANLSLLYSLSLRAPIGGRGPT